MKYLPVSFLLVTLLSGLAAADSSLDLAAQLARSGAPQSALARIERDQPAQADTPLWWQWETLRLSLLVELGRDEAVLQRMALLPAEIPAAARAVCRPLAQAALRQNLPAQARACLAQWLWEGEPDEAQLKEARRLVIQSYLGQRRADAAYLAMLRFRQDYPAPGTGETARFVEQLLLAGGVAEATNWLAQLDEANPLKLLLRLKAHLITPEAAIAAARMTLDPPPLPVESGKGSKKNLKMVVLPVRPVGKEAAAYWSIIAQAAELRRAPEVQAEALERQLNLADSTGDALFGAGAETLWRVYEDLAQAEANRAQLLTGEDAAWFNLAERSAVATPLTARALLAYLAKHAANDEMRAVAQARLAALLVQGNLDGAAARLFAGDGGAEAVLLGQLPAGENLRRSEMLIAFGQVAAARNDPARAAEYYLRAGGTGAKRLAADSLARAGLLEDARRQYGELLK